MKTVKKKKPKKKSKSVARRAESSGHSCFHCHSSIQNEDKALFVEEEVGRVFCSEDCISGFFEPDIQKLEKLYTKNLAANDLTDDERDSLAHLRWLTLQEPDEVWTYTTRAGDRHYTLIAEFRPNNRKIWCVCICLFLRGEPSFLFLAFPTKIQNTVDSFRNGQKVDRGLLKERGGLPLDSGSKKGGFVDHLADSWTEEETHRAQLSQERSQQDIPVEQYPMYHAHIDETLHSPDEIWSIEISEHQSKKMYHFLRHYPDENPSIWYIVIAKDTDEEDQLEILDAFPSRDQNFVDQFRRGRQEVGAKQDPLSQRMIH